MTYSRHLTAVCAQCTPRGDSPLDVFQIILVLVLMRQQLAGFNRLQQPCFTETPQRRAADLVLLHDLLCSKHGAPLLLSLAHRCLADLRLRTSTCHSFLLYPTETDTSIDTVETVCYDEVVKQLQRLQEIGG